MRRSVGMLLLVCLLTGVQVSAQENKTLTVRSLAEAPSFAKRALVIGIGQYEHAGSLAPATYNDAASFADLLKTRFGFPDEAITLLTDAPGTPESRRPTYIHLRNAFQTLLAGINEKSEVVVYFSGHGTRAEDHDWLVPLDGLPSDVNATCINYDEFKSQLNTKTPARALLIVDACRNLSGGKDAGSSGFGAGKGLSGPQFAELLACRPKEESKVGKPEDFSESVFTHFLLQGLQGDRDAQENGVVTFDSLNEYVQGRVSQYVSNKYGESQNPEGRASLGKMVLIKTAGIPNKAIAGSPEKMNRVVGRRLTGAVRPAEAQAGDVWVNPKDGAEMVYIPAGPFQMGDDDMNDNRRHTVTLSGYWIYKNLVTVGQYKKFCRETGRRMPSDPGGYNIGDTVIAKFNPDWSKEDNPMVDVSWEDATAYAQWAGVSLPTEAQWEKAARGTDGRKYPWGDAFDLLKLWCSRKHLADAGGTTAVGEYGISPYGCTDMSGNAQQWCLDTYDAKFWSSRAATGVDPVNLAGGDQAARVIRGGDWLISPVVEYFFRTASRSNFLPANINDGIGFRCAAGK